MNAHYFVPNVHATTFYRYGGQIESLAYAGDLMRQHPNLRAAALPVAIPSANRRSWTFDPDLSLQNAVRHRGIFVVPFYRGRFSIAQVLDVGPWWTTGKDDVYWQDGRRPRAEELHAKSGTLFSPQQGKEIRVTNPAGVDFTPQVWVDLGFDPSTAFAEKVSARVDIAVIERW